MRHCIARRRIARHRITWRSAIHNDVGCYRANRQPHDKLGARAQTRAAGLHGTTVHLDEQLHERESDSQSALRPIEGALGLSEQIEDAR